MLRILDIDQPLAAKHEHYKIRNIFSVTLYQRKMMCVWRLLMNVNIWFLFSPLRPQLLLINPVLNKNTNTEPTEPCSSSNSTRNIFLERGKIKHRLTYLADHISKEPRMLRLLRHDVDPGNECQVCRCCTKSISGNKYLSGGLSVSSSGTILI